MVNGNGKVLYLLADGDDIGNTVQYHLLTSDIEGVHTFSQTVSEAFSYLSSEIVNILDANIIFLGGDDILAEIPSNVWYSFCIMIFSIEKREK
jgi:CRISPR/Cas system-associated protein Cas10 (large subunit of type III CRISPR-Cas system)